MDAFKHDGLVSESTAISSTFRKRASEKLARFNSADLKKPK